MRRLLAMFAATALLAAGCTTTAPKGAPSSVDRPPTTAEINTQLGIGYLGQGRPDLALAKLERALDLEPDLPAAHNAMGLVRSRLGQDEQAERHFRRAIELEPDNSYAHNNLGVFLCERGRFEEAEEQFLAALRNPLYRTPAQAYENAGLCALRAGEEARAEQYLRKALGQNSHLPRSLYHMARIEYAGGDAAAAREFLDRYEEVGEHTAKSLWLAVQVSRALEDRDAEASYALLLRARFPDSEQARQVRRQP